MIDTTVRELMVALGYEVDESSRKKAINDAKELKSTVSKLLGMVGITVSLAGVVKFGNDAKQAASDVEQMEQKFDVVFQGIERETDQWAQNLADAIGRSKNSIKTYLADNQNLLVGFNMDRKAAAQLSEQMVQSAIDIASFANLNEDDAVRAMSKALMGETESAKTLGAVLNDNTIATAMETLGLKGKFTALDEATKMQVRYTAIMNQSKDAIGDAARSMGSYESQERQLNAQLKDIKENVGKFILPYATKGIQFLTKLTGKVKEFTEKLGDADEEGTIASKIMSGFQTGAKIAGSAVEKLVDVGKNLVELVGGTENAAKLLGAAVAGLLAYKLGEKALGLAGNLKSVLKVVSAIGAKGMLIAGVAVGLFLIVQDFVGFLQGKDSLFGELLGNAGIDADVAREKFLSFGQGLKEIFERISEAGGEAFGMLREFWDENGAAIMSSVQTGFRLIVGLLSTLASLIGPTVGFVISFIKSLIRLLDGDLQGAIEAANEAWEYVGEFITNLVTGIWNTVNEFFGGLPEKALAWGKDMLQSFIDGISQKIGALKDKITGVAKTIREKLHFSKPDNGPLQDADKWTPDMMELFAKGIESRKAKLRETVTGVAGLIKGAVVGESGEGIRLLASSAKASAANAGSVTSNRSVVQNLQFVNTFNGGAVENQKQAAAQMDKNAKDASSYLAHALALGR